MCAHTRLSNGIGIGKTQRQDRILRSKAIEEEKVKELRVGERRKVGDHFFRGSPKTDEIRSVLVRTRVVE